MHMTPIPEVGIVLSGDVDASLPRTPVRGSQNPNSELDYARVSEVPIIDHMDALHSEGSSWLINETNVETLFGVKFTSQSDIEVFSMSIKKGKYVDILSMISSVDIDAVVNAIKTIRKKFKVDVSNSSPLVSSSTIINVPRKLNSIDVAATFGVPLSTANRNNAYVIPCKVSHEDDSINLNVDESTIPSDPIVQSMGINTKSTSYAGDAGASAKEQRKVNSNFRTLVADPIFDGVNVFIPREVVRKKSPIILKKWSTNTRLLKEKLTRIPIWVKLHDVPIQVFEEDGISLIATFIGKPVMLDSYTSSMCNESWGRSSFARCLIKVMTPPIVTTSNVITHTIRKTNDGFQTVSKKKKSKGKSKSTNAGQFTGPSVKQNVRYEPKATTTAPKKGATYVGNTSQSSSMLKTAGNSSKKENLSMSNSFSALNDEEENEEEDVEIVHDESANLNTKAGGSSSFTAAHG
nr:zinc knuckle CX2CX4HX4C [Tanacetum cinerariifolium]